MKEFNTMDMHGPIYTTLIDSAKAEGRPYDTKQLQVIRDTVEELSKRATSAARPGMLLGKIQSGKTKTFLGVIALAVDNGYDLVIVLTKGTNALSEQTYQRLSKSFAQSIDEDLIRVYDIMKFPSSLTKHELKRPIMIVAKKQVKNLERLDKLLFDNEKIPGLGKRKTLIIDDEADFASIGFKKKDEDGFAEMQTIMQQMDSLRGKLEKISFLQVTATPYSLYLQPKDTVGEDGALFRPIRPAFTQLVPTHSFYIGGDFYFEHTDDPDHVGSYVFVPVEAEELEILEEQDRRRFKIEESLTSPKIATLRRAILDFVTGSVIRRLQLKKEKKPLARYAFVLHSMAKRTSHEWQCQVTQEVVNRLSDAAENDPKIFGTLIRASYDDFKDSVKAADQWLPPFEDVLKQAQIDVEKIKIEKVNSDNDVKELLDASGQLELRNALNMFVGGSILDRGLTIDNLIGFYYGRRANRYQQDTVLQHHRMYGARPKADMAVTRFYTTQTLYDTLQTIHEFDSALRKSIEAGGGNDGIAFIRKQGQQIIPCSPNKLLISDVTTLRPGKRLLPVAFQTKYKSYTAAPLKKLDEFIESLVGKKESPDPVLISEADALRLLDDAVDLFDSEEGELEFNLDGWKSSIRYVSRNCPNETRRGQVYLLVRKNRKNVRQRASGRFFDAPDTSHVEGEIARSVAVDLPMLMLFRQGGAEEDGWRGSPFYWPVIYMPQQMGTVVFANDVNDFDEDSVVPVDDD